MAEIYDITKLGSYDDKLLQSLCEILNVVYTRFPFVWQRKWEYQTRMWWFNDKYGWNNRICRDVVNLILSRPVKIWTPNETINALIESEIKGRLHLDTNLARQLVYCMGIGDMLMSIYTNPITNQLDINYIMGQNVIPIEFDSAGVYKVAWFQTKMIEKTTYIIVVIESFTERETRLYEWKNATLTQFSFGSSAWSQILGGVKPIIYFRDYSLHSRFAWISTGLGDVLWADSPFSRSFISEFAYFDEIENIYDKMHKDLENSGKIVFLPKSMIPNQNSVIRDEQGNPIEFARMKWKDGLFVATNDVEEIRDYAPPLLIEGFYRALMVQLQSLTESVGLGHDMYNFDKMKVEITATQTILSNRGAFNTIQTIQYNLVSALQTIIFAFVQEWYAQKIITKADWEQITNAGSIEVEFDNGVFIDRDRKIASYFPLVANNFIDQKTFLIDAVGYSRQKADQIRGNTALVQQLALKMQQQNNKNKQEKVEQKEH